MIRQGLEQSFGSGRALKGAVSMVFTCLAQAEFLIVLVVIAVIALAVYGHIQAQKRREAMAQLARSLGLSFDPEEDYGMDDRFASFSCLRQGEQRYAYNTLQGMVREHPVRAFDYHYETYSTDSKGRRTTHHHHFSAVIVDSGLPLKPLFIRPEGFLDKITEFFGWDDIDFESAEFSRKFYVKSPDKRWAFDVIHQATMEFLLESPVFTLDFQGRHVMAYRDNKFDPQEFIVALEVIEGVLSRLPKSVLRELKGEVS